MIEINQPTVIPTRIVGPIKIIGNEFTGEVNVPLATLEKPLWFSVNRGARVSMLTSGIRVAVVKDCMTRSVLLEADNAEYANDVVIKLNSRFQELREIAAKGSKFAELQDFHTQIVGNLLFIRFSMTTGDAAGHNMVTKAADELLGWILQEYQKLQYVSVSGNFCADKKVSAVNGILGRGKYVVAELLIPREICVNRLKATPEKIVDLNIKKNLIGTILGGGVRTANAHFANILLACYLATGQDAANIIEGSQGIVHAEVRGDDLYFAVTLPNIIVGTVGSGKDLEFVRDNLAALGCIKEDAVGANARRLAIIIAAAVLCGELSLLSALTNKGELMQSHIKIER